MDCFNNTCLSCDRECESHYCSQACKLADIERGANTSASTSPSTSMGPIRSKSWQTSRQSPSHAPDATTYSYPVRSPATGSRHSQSSYFISSMSTEATELARSTERSLTPSSSRSSLSSAASLAGSAHTLSAQNNQQLQDYFNSFEKVRAAKRRSSLR